MDQPTCPAPNKAWHDTPRLVGTITPGHVGPTTTRPPEARPPEVPRGQLGMQFDGHAARVGPHAVNEASMATTALTHTPSHTPTTSTQPAHNLIGPARPTRPCRTPGRHSHDGKHQGTSNRPTPGASIWPGHDTPYREGLVRWQARPALEHWGSRPSLVRWQTRPPSYTSWPLPPSRPHHAIPPFLGPSAHACPESLVPVSRPIPPPQESRLTRLQLSRASNSGRARLTSRHYPTDAQLVNRHPAPAPMSLASPSTRC